MDTAQKVIWQTRHDYNVDNEVIALELVIIYVTAFLKGQSYEQINEKSECLLNGTGWDSERRLKVQKRALEIMKKMEEL